MTKISLLRSRIIKDMTVRNLSPATQGPMFMRPSSSAVRWSDGIMAETG